jgi:hypothetical protein
MASGARELYEEFVAGSVKRIRQAALRNEPETHILDFKENRDKSGEPSGLLSDHGREILGKAISAFANTNGGLLVWGVESKNRRANVESPIPQIDHFVRDLQSATSASVYPIVIGVEHKAVHSEDGASGFALTYVPESLTKPHQCVANQSSMNYWMRSGDSIKPMPHAFVRALFSERAKPLLKLSMRCESCNGVGGPNSDTITRTFIGVIQLENAGELLAREIAIAVSGKDSRMKLHLVWGASQNVQIQSRSEDEASWQATLYSRQHALLYPGQLVNIGQVEVQFPESNVPRDLWVRYVVYADSFSVEGFLELPFDEVRL